MEFRTLRADEIEVRVASAKQTGVQLLLFKDARVDQNILDETVGAMNWQRHHTRDNANCIVSIWDKDKEQWVSKEDTGTESNTEKEKGLASDSFKRACFNWGIGRELYTAPFIWIKADHCMELKQDGKWKCYDSFEVEKIVIENKRIVELTIAHKKTGAECFHWELKKKFSPVVCEVCGRAINAYKGANGKPVSVSRHCDGAKAKFGRVLCLDCIDALMEQENGDNV